MYLKKSTYSHSYQTLLTIKESTQLTILFQTKQSEETTIYPSIHLPLSTMSFEQEQKQSFKLQLPVLDLKLDLGDWMDGIGNETAELESKVKSPEPEETEKAIKRPCDRAVKPPCDYRMMPEDIPGWLQHRSAYSSISQRPPIWRAAESPIGQAAERGVERYVISLDQVAAFLIEMQTLIHETIKLDDTPNRDEPWEMARDALRNRYTEIKRDAWGWIKQLSFLSRDLNELIEPKADSTHPPPLYTRLFWEGVRRTLIEKGLNQEIMRKKFMEIGKKCMEESMEDEASLYRKVFQKVIGWDIEEMETKFGQIPREFFVPYCGGSASSW